MPGPRARTAGSGGVSGGQVPGGGQGHGHGLPGAGHRRPLAIVLGITATILAVEVIGAFVSGSLALLADAGHMLTDVAGLSLALVAAVLAAAAVIALTGWDRADAVASLGIGALILPRTWKLLRESVDVLMEATPKSVDLAHVRAHILGVPHVHAVHDLHASLVASDLPVLTAHVVVDDSCFRDGHLPRLLDQLQQCLAGHFDVEHSTVQFEPASHAGHEHPAHA
jgi:cobalt-zinc-cadmium efflux system protein